MPLYRIRIQAAQTAQQDLQLGFYKDCAATDYARRIARGAAAEVWRGSVLIARVEARVPAEESA